MNPKTVNKRAVKLVREMRELGARPYNGKNLAEYNRKREALLTLCIEAIENGVRFESKTENTEEK